MGSMNISIDLMSNVNKSAIAKGVQSKWNAAIRKALPYIQADIRDSMISGKMFKQPFTRTKLWDFLNTSRALAELGFVTLKPLDEDLLVSLQESTFVKIRGGKKIIIQFVDMDIVAAGTIHRSAGTGQLGEISWFVDWIINGMPVRDYEFVKTGPPVPRSSRIAGSEAGLMLESSGGGLWKFPPVFKGEFEEWVLGSLKDMELIVYLRVVQALNKV